MEMDSYFPGKKFLGQDIKAFVPEITHHHIVINGFPCDQGTKINRGRIGESTTTTMLRKALSSHEISKKEMGIFLSNYDQRKRPCTKRTLRCREIPQQSYACQKGQMIKASQMLEVQFPLFLTAEEYGHCKKEMIWQCKLFR